MKVPQFLSKDVITEIFDSVEPRPCIAELRDGLSKVGIFQVNIQPNATLHGDVTYNKYCILHAHFQQSY